MTNPFLKLRINSKKYIDKNVLNDIILEINKGEVISIMGSSGCGKTTLARCIAGFENFDGRIELNGRDISKLHSKDRRIGIVPQECALFPHLNVEENVGYGIKDKAIRKSKIQELLKIVELDDIQDILKKKVDQLSGGQKQRVAVARALSGDPDVIILDESFTSLDQRLRGVVRKQILDSIKQTKTTVMVITHDIEEAFELGDRIAVLEDGNLVQFDDSVSLYSRPKSVSIAKLVGVTNVIKYVRDLYGDQYIDFVYKDDESNASNKVLMLRPEHIQKYNPEFHIHEPLSAVIKEIKVNGPMTQAYLLLVKTEETVISTDVDIARMSIGDSLEIGFSSSAIIYSG